MKAKAFVPIACVVLILVFANGWRGNVDDLLDRSVVLEVADVSKQKSLIPFGVGAFKLKMEMHHDEGWLEREGRFFVLSYKEPSDELREELFGGVEKSLLALEAWARRDRERPVKIWIDGLPFNPTGLGLGTDGVVTANEFAQFCTSYAEQARLAAQAYSNSRQPE